VIRSTAGYLDDRTGQAPLLRKALRYVFPDHWSFLLGEIALYSFVVLVVTGIYLSLFFDPSTTSTVYHGSYAPLQGAVVSQAYRSTVDLSLSVKAGLLMRQTHHWAALLFVAAITVHLMRIFFTGAYRRPRDLNYLIGLTMLTLAVLEGFAGYSLPDDLLSGMGLAIGYSVALAIPVVGANVAFLVWGGEFPGPGVIESRLYILHVLLLPLALAALIGIHLTLIVLQKHTQFGGRGRTERNVVGTPMWPGYALRSLGLFLGVTGVLFLLGGLVQINPVWQWGPYEPWLGTNAAQPDWYLGWLIGALRLMPSFDVHVFGYTIFPNPFFGGLLFPAVVFGILYAWPFLERRYTGDRAMHHLLDRPRDAPRRTAFGAAFFSWVAVIFLAGSADRLFVTFGASYALQLWIFRIASFVVPVVVFFATRAVCRELAARDLHPVRDPAVIVVRRTPSGGFEPVGSPDEQE
jgi:ubiquinol-cytochrome c reductase cytochrome b subunit